ncbi:A-kinase anchor protein 14 [Octopus bimaculoides]|nr:A-kinase anchor protein 14 [Octopus bimaculoides]|eukprot:XP_014769761.1 PREDICTED: A-kinase anchor protein 14-like [Octopus bimaculoides]
MEASTDESPELSESQEISLEKLTYGCVEEILARALKHVQETQCPSCNTYIDPDLSSTGQCQNCETLIDELVGYTIETAKENLMAESGRDYVFNEYGPPKNIIWFNIDQYSTDMALRKIDQYIRTWEFHPSWLYCIDYIATEEFEFDNYHKFRVRWSIPTQCKPIPRGTVCIYFTFRVSKIKPKNYPVEVSFVIETNQLIHRPGKTRFREKWLKDVIESKIKYNCLNC